MSIEAAIENGDFQQALANLEHETSGPAVDPGRLLMRFNMEVRLQRFDAAQATMRRLVAAAPEVAAPMSAFAAAAQAEQLATLRRRDPAHAGKGSAIGLPPPHLLALMKASVCHTHGDAHGARGALAEAASLTPATSGTITRVGGAVQPFTAISDSDELTGATLPVYDGDKLLDLAFSELASVTFHDPKTSFDVMWSVADIEMVDGTRLRGRIPSFYAGTGVAADGSVRTGQQTTWQRDRGYAEALGQRDWSIALADGGRSMVGILGVQRIEFDNPRRAVAHAGGHAGAHPSGYPGAHPGGHAGGPSGPWGQAWPSAPGVAAPSKAPSKTPAWVIPVAIIAVLGGGLGLVSLMSKGRSSAAGSQSPAAKYEPPARRATSLDSYADLCTNKDPFPGAKKYQKGTSPSAPSKVAVFRKYLDEKHPKYQSESRPATFEGVFATDKDVDQVELVACVDLKRSGKPLFCNYYGAQVEIFDMTHTLRILEATTGKVVKEETFDLDRRTEKCAGSVTGSSYRGADYFPKLISTLLPFQPEGVALAKVERVDLDAVCSGSPIPQAAPYKPGAGKRAVHMVYFPVAEQSSTRESLPDGLAISDPVEEDVTKYELVACVTGKPLKKKASCDFTSGKVLELHEGEFEVAMYEAATGKLVEKKTFKGSPGSCPFSYSFFGQVDKRMLKIEPAFQSYWATMTGGTPPKAKAQGGGSWGGLDDRLD